MRSCDLQRKHYVSPSLEEQKNDFSLKFLVFNTADWTVKQMSTDQIISTITREKKWLEMETAMWVDACSWIVVVSIFIGFCKKSECGRSSPFSLSPADTTTLSESDVLLSADNLCKWNRFTLSLQNLNAVLFFANLNESKCLKWLFLITAESRKQNPTSFSSLLASYLCFFAVHFCFLTKW